jgi:hypothetical protein
MDKRAGMWLAATVALTVALSGGALAAPALSVSPEQGPIQTPVVLTGSGFEPGVSLDIAWQTMVGNRVSGSGFAAVTQTIGSATADGAGNLHFEFKAPSDLGGPPHAVAVVQGNSTLATASFTILRTANISPTSGPLGTTIELHMTGGGWTQYDNIVTVTYDNAYIGYMCSFNTQGNMTTWFPASGGVGLHSVDVYPALYTGPSDGAMPWKLPHLSQGDQPWQPPVFHFEFTVTDMNGSVPQAAGEPPAAAAQDGAGGLLAASFAVLAAAGAGAVAFEVPIRRARGRPRWPAAAAVVSLVAIAVFASLGAPAQAEGASTGDPPIVLLSTAGPVVALSAGTAEPGAAVTLTGAGLPAHTDVELRWSTATVKAKADGEKFLGWNVTPGEWVLGTASTDASGAFTRTIAAPFDYSGPHQVSVVSSGATLASSGLIVVPRFEIVGPTHVRAGQQVTVRGYGLGYEKYSAGWNVAYDNRLTGWVSGMEAHGNVSFTLYAVGEPGQHFIDVGEGAVGFPYLNLWESPFQNRPPAHLWFVIDAGAPLPTAPATAAGGGLGATLLPVAALAATAVLAVQFVRWRFGSAPQAPPAKGRV